MVKILANLRPTLNIFPLWSPEMFLTINYFTTNVIIYEFLRLTAEFFGRLTVNPIETLLFRINYCTKLKIAPYTA